MSGKLNSFLAHVPEGIQKDNHTVLNFLEVFDGLLKIRAEELDNYTRSFYFPAVSDIRIMRRYVDEWDAEYLETSSRLCIDCLYRNYHYIYSRKGTVSGVKRLLTCLFYDTQVPVVSGISFSGGKPLILSDDTLFVDWLPEGADIQAELGAVVGSKVWCPTLLDNTWLDSYTTFSVTIALNYIPTPKFIEFVKSVLVLYLPMVNTDILTIDININNIA